MTNIILVIHLILAIALVGIVLLQRSEGGALGMGGGGGGGGGGMAGFMTGRATADMLTRTTAIIAACFMITSMTLAILANNDRGAGSILDKPAPAAPTAPAKPAEPSVPLAK
ncbi:MAG: preprotein translocase subunit SecG [Rhodospirillales bacterium]|nr:preprotein translocase subunit SecG [Rhodospirillales bacterium]